MSTMPLKDLIFELNDVGQPKICIAVCDSAEERKRITENILAELDEENVKTALFKFDSSQTDLVAKLQEHRRSNKTEVVIVDGLESLNEKSVEHVLAKLNFRRDILASLNVSLLLWVTNSLLKELIARAPDFWSRRTATYFFNRIEVKEYLKRIFGQENITDSQTFANRKISRALGTVLSNETKLNELVKSSKRVSPIQIDKLVGAISMGLESLIHDSNDGKSFLITMSLWNLGDLDNYIRRYTWSAKIDRSNFYDLRTTVFLEVSRRLANILKNYKKNLLKRANEQQAASLMAYFGKSAINSAIKILQSLSIERRRREVNIVDLEPWAGFTTFYYAPEQLTDWLTSSEAQLPGLFTKADGKLLRILYNESKNVVTIAKKLKISKAQAKQRIAELKDKVCAFLGSD